MTNDKAEMEKKYVISHIKYIEYTQDPRRTLPIHL